MALELTSPAFDDGGPIPREYGYTERDVNPPLGVAGVPDDAASLALVMDDPDAVEPAGKVWDHWVVWNVPPDATEIPAGWSPASVGASEGQNDYGEPGYGGPNPPDGEHTYRFELYALDADLDLPASADADDLRAAAEGHVLDEALLRGTYAP
ncbi:MAG: YbhB/YbcL family Raf kinase inhibitor-like protein [Haloferacaceae archaeon]